VIRTLLGALFALFTLGILAVAGGIILLGYSSNQAGPLDEPIFFTIERNESLSSIAERLEEKRAIKSSLLFQAGAYTKGENTKFRYGNFEIPNRSSPNEIISILTKTGSADDRYRIQTILANSGIMLRIRERQPISQEYTVLLNINWGEELPNEVQDILNASTAIKYSLTVVEGLTSWQVITHLNAAPFFQGEIEATPSEGALAPSTYPFKSGTSRQSIINVMQETQVKILNEEWQNRSDESPVSSPEEAVILASIIEKETGRDEEREIIASVFANRLKNDWPLQADPTIVYGLTEGKEPLGRGLRKSELAKDTPFNSYIHKGLPPTPIANPSRASIRAALNPNNSEYYFFVADGSGGHKFASTYAEHQQNVREWRKLE